MDPRLAPIAEIYDLNTDLLLNCLEGVSDVHAAERVVPGTNSLAFIAAHLIDARHNIANFLGRPLPNPLETTLGGVERIEDAPALPAVREVRGMWLAVSSHLRDCLEGASADLLAAPSPVALPVGDPSLLGGIAFLAEHESFHVGQLAFLRKALGYPAMSFTRPPPGP
ncbi:MAG: DinB family protein [Candidatus Eisenbacteria bacterium]|nr:DinB family protein [Candidatus Eisenbacteria bacterium]